MSVKVCFFAAAREEAGTAELSLQLGECATSLGAAANLMLRPAISLSFAMGGMTSARGRSYAFDDRADGYVRSEACGAIALRRQDGDAPLSLLGSAVRHDGRSASLAAPNGLAQRTLLAGEAEVVVHAGVCRERAHVVGWDGVGMAVGPGAPTRQGHRRPGAGRGSD